MSKKEEDEFQRVMKKYGGETSSVVKTAINTKSSYVPVNTETRVSEAKKRLNEEKKSKLPMLNQKDLYKQHKEVADFRNAELKSSEIEKNKTSNNYLPQLTNEKDVYSKALLSGGKNAIKELDVKNTKPKVVNNYHDALLSGNKNYIKDLDIKDIKVKTNDADARKADYRDSLLSGNKNAIRTLDNGAEKLNFIDDVKDVGKSLYVGTTQASNSIYKIADLLYTGGAKATDLLLPKSIYDIDKDNLYQGTHKKLQDVMSTIEKQNQELRESYVNDKGAAKKILTTAGEAIPAIIATMFAGAGLANASMSTAPLMEGLLSATTKASILRMMPFFGHASGGYAREAELDGASYGQQVLYGIAGGLAETVTEAPMMTKWIDMFGKKTMQSMMHKGGKELAKNLGKVGIDWLTNIAGETLQEAAVEPMTGFAKKAIYDPNKKLYGDGGVVDVNAIKEAGFGGFSMAIVLGAFGLPSTYASHKMATKYAKDGTEMTQADFNALNEQFEKDIQSLNKNEVATIEQESPGYLKFLREAEEEAYQNQNDIMANGEFDNAQILADTANALEIIPQENPVMEEIKQKVIQRNRETAQQILATLQIDNTGTHTEPTQRTNIEGNAIIPPQANVKSSVNSEAMNSNVEVSDMVDTADISNSKEIKAVKVKSINVDPQRFQFKADTNLQN